MQFYVYLHLHDDLPFYVGKGHGYRAYNFTHRSQHHKAVINKYGRKNIEVIIFNCASESIAFHEEKAWIKMLREHGCKLCNHTDGGEGISGYCPSQEVRAKLSASHMGKKRKPFTAEHREKLRAALIGRKHSDAARAAISAAQIGNKRNLGKKRGPMSDATKRKISAALMGNKNGQRNF